MCPPKRVTGNNVVLLKAMEGCDYKKKHVVIKFNQHVPRLMISNVHKKTQFNNQRFIKYIFDNYFKMFVNPGICSFTTTEL